MRRQSIIRSCCRVLLFIGLWQMAPDLLAQTVPPTYKGGLTLTEPAKISPWRLDLMGGYQFFGSLRLVEGRLRIRDSFNWGGSLSYGWRSNNRFTITYINQPTELWLDSYGPVGGFVGNRRLTDLNAHYVLLGSIQEFPTDGPVQPYAGAQAGLVVFDPINSRYGSETRFAFSLTGGARGKFAGPLGWKLQASLLLPVLWTEGGLFCEPGGCSIGLASGRAIVQMNTNAGITISF